VHAVAVLLLSINNPGHLSNRRHRSTAVATRYTETGNV